MTAPKAAEPPVVADGEAIERLLRDLYLEAYGEGAEDYRIEGELPHKDTRAEGCYNFVERHKADLRTLLAMSSKADDVDRLPCNFELSWCEVDGDPSECAWHVHSVNGGRNDREWTTVAVADTPSQAISKALASLTMESGDAS